jgi:hypothetical protein
MALDHRRSDDFKVKGRSFHPKVVREEEMAPQEGICLQLPVYALLKGLDGGFFDLFAPFSLYLGLKTLFLLAFLAFNALFEDRLALRCG